MIRVLITGDRRWRCESLARRVLASLKTKHGLGELTVIHGVASGVDRAFEVVANQIRIATEPYPADWSGLGRKAGPIRNQQMVDSGADLCLAFRQTLQPDNGTADCCRRAILAGIPTWWTSSDHGRPIRLTRESPEVFDPKKHQALGSDHGSQTSP